MTSEQRIQLTDLVKQLRAIAQPVGAMHSFWDTIFDIEALLDGQQTLLHQTPEEWIADCKKCLLSNSFLVIIGDL